MPADHLRHLSLKQGYCHDLISFTLSIYLFDPGAKWEKQTQCHSLWPPIWPQSYFSKLFYSLQSHINRHLHLHLQDPQHISCHDSFLTIFTFRQTLISSFVASLRGKHHIRQHILRFQHNSGSRCLRAVVLLSLCLLPGRQCGKLFCPQMWVGESFPRPESIINQNVTSDPHSWAPRNQEHNMSC